MLSANVYTTGFVMCGVCLCIVNSYPSWPRSPQRKLGDILNCLRIQSSGTASFVDSSEDYVDCSKILRHVPWRDPQCVFSPIKCMFRDETELSNDIESLR
ncbi:hypothetical protein Q1695_011399 [Nippostrongylus brasiliensis]|nr:hypothetical protein Q1695_011399 [Nippostrongylus brasiliensis]